MVRSAPKTFLPRALSLWLLALAAILCFGGAFLAGPAQAASGGLSPRADEEDEAAEAPSSGEAAIATLVGGKATAPASAPRAVKRVIAAANRIRTTPYVWGGGHSKWSDRGYDCSGAVSYALRGGGLIESPLVSGSFATWGAPGPGRWITIYANRKHVYAVIAGLRWDTGGNPSDTTGPRWHAESAYPKGYAVRHPIGY